MSTCRRRYGVDCYQGSRTLGHVGQTGVRCARTVRIRPPLARSDLNVLADYASSGVDIVVFSCPCVFVLGYFS
ncbi:hypothetical protein [Corynebacterium kroppenstedtii]